MIDLKRLRAGRAWRALMLDEAGRLKPEAKIVLDDLAGYCRLTKPVPLSPEALAAAEGSRRVLSFILRRLKKTDLVNEDLIKKGVFGDD